MNASWLESVLQFFLCGAVGTMLWTEKAGEKGNGLRSMDAFENEHLTDGSFSYSQISQSQSLTFIIFSGKNNEIFWPLELKLAGQSHRSTKLTGKTWMPKKEQMNWKEGRAALQLIQHISSVKSESWSECGKYGQV